MSTYKNISRVTTDHTWCISTTLQFSCAVHNIWHRSRLDRMKAEALGGHNPQDRHLFYTTAYGKSIGRPRYDRIPTYTHHAIPKRCLSPKSAPKAWTFLNLLLVPTAKWHEISFCILYFIS